MRFSAVVVLACVSFARADARAQRFRSIVQPNDNRVPAGTLTGGVLTVHLEARSGQWRPDGNSGPTLTTAAFAEVGKALQIPGPLLRVAAGTEIRATVRNELGKSLWLYGFGAERGLRDSTRIPPHGTSIFRFVAAEAGAFYYAGRTDTMPVLFRLAEDSQLSGVIIVDPPGPRPDDRVFAITTSTWFDKSVVSGVHDDGTFAFNGRSFPGTEKFVMTEGDTARWRFVNISGFDHPLHLHGFYFRVDAKGDGVRDTIYTDRDRRQAVTEYLAPGQTTALTWSPARAGNWIFHCHFAGHMAGRGAWNTDRTVLRRHSSRHLMSGLVLPITVRPRGEITLAGEAARPLRLVIRSRARVYGDYVGYSFALGGTPEERDTIMRVPGPVLELTRGERVAVTIVNRSHEGAAVHWHGIELESYADGVPGFSGSGTAILPMIRPGDSLTVRFTPPRAGTFMYHSHSNEFQQISSGLYGALIVREPGAVRDAARERTWLFSDGGPLVNLVDIGKLPPALLNGETAPRDLDIPGNVPVRIRIIGIRSDIAVDVALLDGATPVSWRILAKDGMPATDAQSLPRPARLALGSGEIYDVEVMARPGPALTLSYGIVGLPPQVLAPVTVPVRVH